MNTYTQTIPSNRPAQMEAPDEAMGKRIPVDVLQYVLLPMLDGNEVKTMHTVKLQPRNVSKEMKNYCRLHYGRCGLCSFNLATCVCMTPAAALLNLVRLPVLVITGVGSLVVILGTVFADLCCEIQCCNSNDVCTKIDDLRDCVGLKCPGDLMPCAGDDYRLQRSCCHDVAQLANQCCCCAGMSAAHIRPPPPRNGPQAMFMV